MVLVLFERDSSFKTYTGKQAQQKRNYILYYYFLNSLFYIQVTWPTQWTQSHPDFCQADLPVFLLTVDGVHCRIEEPQHPTKSKDPSYYSHKFNTAGVDYELGISGFDNKLVWINGPMTKASRHDVTVFRRAGLQAMIPDGHRVIGDSGYAGEPTVVSTPNAHDPVTLRRFKSRA